MGSHRSHDGAIGALLGLIGGYLLRWWQERGMRRDVALLRKLTRQNSAAQSRNMEGRLKGLHKERGGD